MDFKQCLLHPLFYAPSSLHCLTDFELLTNYGQYLYTERSP